MWFIIIGVICIIVAIVGAVSISRRKKSIDEQVDELQGIYDPSRGGVSAQLRSWQSKKRSELADSLTTEAASATTLSTAQIGVMSSEYEVERTPDRLEVRKQVEIAAEKKEVETARFTQEENLGRLQEGRDLEAATSQRNLGMVENEKQVIEKATDEGLHAGTYLKTEEKRQLDKLEVEKHREMKGIDIEVLKAEAQIDVQGAIISRVAEQFEVELLTQRMFVLLDQRETLLLSPDTEGTRKKLRRLNKNIKALEKAIDEKAQGLIQGNSRPELKAMEES